MGISNGIFKQDQAQLFTTVTISPIPFRLKHQGTRLRTRNGGFTYIGLLLLVTILSVMSVTMLQLGTTMHRRLAEEALLEIGTEFQQAFTSYANATPLGQNRAPSSLEDLLRDPRYPIVRRHLRQIYIDPMTGSADWGIVRLPGTTTIFGVYSRSLGKPIKVDNFDEAFSDFTNKTSYSEWVFGNSGIAYLASQATEPPDRRLGFDSPQPVSKNLQAN